MGSSWLIGFIGVVVHLWNPPGISAGRINLALNATAVQSSNQTQLFAHISNDGNTDPQVCSHTTLEVRPWWRLHLPAVYRVDEIKVYNRDVAMSYLSNIHIHIGNSLENNGKNNPRCAILNYKNGCQVYTINCWGMEGKFISLHKEVASAMYLVLCEVEVYGELAPPSVTINDTERHLTLVEKRLCWSDALTYCRDFYWDLLSIRVPEDHKMVDELVASAPFPLTSQLWVGLRRSFYGSSWFWMSGDAMEFEQWDFSTNQSHLCGGVTSVKPSHLTQHSCDESRNFICFTGPTEGVNKLYYYSSSRVKQISCK